MVYVGKVDGPHKGWSMAERVDLGTTGSTFTCIRTQAATRLTPCPFPGTCILSNLT